MQNTEFTLNGSEATWVMPTMEGELGGTYKGTFVFRCFLDPLKQLQAGREYRELLGSLGAQATQTEGHLSFALAQLKHRVIKSPPFWSSTLQESGYAGNIGDLNIIRDVLNAAMRSEELFIEEASKQREATINKSIRIGEEILKSQQDE